MPFDQYFKEEIDYDDTMNVMEEDYALEYFLDRDKEYTSADIDILDAEIDDDDDEFISIDSDGLDGEIDDLSVEESNLLKLF